jgi:hypothetical protein
MELKKVSCETCGGQLAVNEKKNRTYTPWKNLNKKG